MVRNTFLHGNGASTGPDCFTVQIEGQIVSDGGLSIGDASACDIATVELDE